MPCADDPFACCQHPLVRDLAWLLATPDLLAMPWPGRPSREALGLGEDADLAAWLGAIEAQPVPLERHVGEASRLRLGHYHERLWQFLLDTAPATHLIAHNLRVHRGKRTLGELDLLYRAKGDATPTHLEVAIKCYLGLPEGPGATDDQARWIGPSGADSLARKRDHLHLRQLMLTEAPETREALRALLPALPGPLTLRRRLALPGMLFYPWHQSLPPPREAHPDHRRGLWLHWRDWQRWRRGVPRQTRGAVLTKPHWLAVPRREGLQDLATLDARLDTHFRDSATPLHVALHRAGKGWQRLFLVADDWPQRIPLPPSSPALPSSRD